jgi:tetratricopeptide (TPR) repeat protein
VTQPNADPLVGTTVAQYEILARLGGGGMGVVYKALDRKLGRPVALKFLPQQWSHDEDAKQRFLREAQAASATHHPNICTIHDIATADDGQLFIVMAHYEGQTLKHRLESGPLPVDEALDIGTQVADGLAKAHAQGVVHRDIKPGNLILTEDGVRIVDFGLATFADALQLTVHGSTLGTAAYMSPEQARGEEVDARTDVWALGVVLYEMLAGQVPFRGTHAEAIAYAIRHDPPPPLRAKRPEVPEEVEQLVFRALHKDPAIRFASGRELSRALRQVRGFTVPQDLRTEAIPVPPALGREQPRKRRRGRLAAIVGVTVVAAAAVTWAIIQPSERVAVTVAPVANQTGYSDLDPMRAALTLALTEQLAGSRDVRVTSYSRLLEMLRGHVQSGRDISSSEAIQTLGVESGAHVVAVPTIIYADKAWRARVELRDAATAAVSATREAAFETEPVLSILNKETAYALMGSLAADVLEHFASPRTRLEAAVARMFGNRPSLTPPVRTLDAAKALEEGISAYDDLEYAAALKAFTAAADQDRRSPVPLAWISRVAMLMRQSDAAADAADRALALAGNAHPRERIFIEAVAAEATRDYETADGRYAQLAAAYPDDPAGIMERGGYQDRRAANADAIASYRRALEIDGKLVRPHLELCRLYNRTDDVVTARAEGSRALERYRALKSGGGEGQALLCLADALRVGTPAERGEALTAAENAVARFEQLGYTYNSARALSYVGLALDAQGRYPEAIAAWEKALGGARAAGNAALEPRVAMNLGVAHEALGNIPATIDYYRRSYELNEKLGDEREAARSLANAGAIAIEYGGDLTTAVRDLENALGVFRRIGDRTFEIFALQLLAARDRYAGRHDNATRALNQARSLAQTQGLDEDVASLTIDLARSHLDLSDYPAARMLLEEAVAASSGRDKPHARIRLAQALARTGELDRASMQLDQAQMEIRSAADSGLEPLLYLALGELAHERGRTDEARAHWTRSASLAKGEYPDPATIEARATLILLDEPPGPPAERAAAAALTAAMKTGRVALEAECRLVLARVQIGIRRFDAAIDTLEALPRDGASTIGRELQGLAHFWRSVALAGRGDNERARAEAAAARTLLTEIASKLPDRTRAAFAARPDIRRVLG